MPQKKFLEDVVIIRLVLIVLLLFVHAFAIYRGSWDKPVSGIPDIPAYWWIAATSYSFMIESFVFISGYLLGWQFSRKGRDFLSFNHLVVKKAKRLLLPSILFSIVYYSMFLNLHKPAGQIAYTIINGCGHLWFLPMLFWCFVGLYIVEKICLPKKILLPFVIIASLCSFLSLPLRISNAMYYFVFFYGGYLIAQHREEITKRIKGGHVIASIVLYVATFVPLVQVKSGMILPSGGGANN